MFRSPPTYDVGAFDSTGSESGITLVKMANHRAELALEFSARGRRQPLTPQDLYTVCYEGIQRKYRNCVIRHARQVLPSVPDWEEVFKRTFSKEWDSIVENADERRVTGEIGTDLKDDLDYLGVNHFYNLFSAFFDTLFPMREGVAKRARQQERQAVLGWSREIRALRDPVSHPSEEDLTEDDAIRLLDSARRILNKIDQSVAAEVHEIRHKISSSEEDHPWAPLAGDLPPAESIATQFVGRNTELEVLREWFATPLAKRWALMGDGGKGKTAIAYQFATEIQEVGYEGYEFVIWLSAKKRRYSEGAVVEITQPDFADLDSALNTILGLYGWEEEVSKDLAEKRAFTLELLNEFPALVVVDDIDSLEGEGEDAIEFFSVDAPTTRSKILLTSRRQPFGLASTTTVVTGLNGADGLEFIRSRISLFGLDEAAFPLNTQQKILKVTDGSPLFAEDLLRLCITGTPAIEAIASWQERSGDEAREYALGREFDMLSRDARQILVTCAAASGPVPLAEILAVTGMRPERAKDAITELQSLFLLPLPRIVQEIERFDLNLNTRGLVRAFEQGSDMYRKCVAGFEALSEDLLISRQKRTKLNEYTRQAVAQVKQDSHSDAESTLLNGLEEMPNEPSLLAQLGWVYKSWKPTRRVADARKTFERACQLNCRAVPMFVHWALLEIDEGEWSGAADAADRGLKCNPNSRELMFYAGYARSRLGHRLVGELQSNATTILVAARQILMGSLADPEALRTPKARLIQSRTFRALVITDDDLISVTVSAGDEASAGPKSKELALEGIALLDRWLVEHPDDDFAVREDAYLRPRFSGVAVTSSG